MEQLLGSPETSGLVFDIKQFSIHDGPGIRTTVFLKGCPLQCFWCHNPESQSPQPSVLYRKERCIICGECVEACPSGAISLQENHVETDRAVCLRCGDCEDFCPADARQLVGKTMKTEEVMAKLEKDRPFFDESGGGATFSGGEPLMQAGFLLSLLQACRVASIHTAIDTSGYVRTDVLEMVAQQTDLVLYDLKHLDPALHLEYTGVSNQLILTNLRTLFEAGIKTTVRIPLIPGFNDSEENLMNTARFLRELPDHPEVQLLPFHKAAKDKHQRFGIPYRLTDAPSPTEGQLERLAECFSKFGLTAQIGG